MTFTPRDYQTATIDAILESFKSHDSVMIELATGLGKTEIFTELLRRWEHGRGLVVCPMNTLVGQAAQKIRQRTGIMPDIEQAENYSNESRWARNQFVVASKQTLTKKRKNKPYRFERFEDIGLVVVDECHLSITKPYEVMLDHFRRNGAKVLGVTATAKRHDEKAMANIYEHCAYQYGIASAVRDGWLVNAITELKQLKTLELRNVNTVAGDFHQGQLAKQMEDDTTVLEIADCVSQVCGNLKTVVFCVSVDEAKLVAEKLCDNYGLSAGWIASDEKRCSSRQQQEILSSFTQDNDGIQIVCNVGILVAGWDFPRLELIVMAAPTKSLPRYTQKFGRGTRPLPGVVDFEGSDPASRRHAIAGSAKPFFRVIDLVDNSLSLKIITSADVLGGEMGIDVVERAKKEIAESSGPVDVEQAVLDAKQALQDEREEFQRRVRARLQATTTYHTLRVDPFDAHQVGGAPTRRKPPAVRLGFGPHTGKILKDVPTEHLRWLKTLEGMKTGGLKKAVTAELERRGNAPKRSAKNIVSAQPDDLFEAFR